MLQPEALLTPNSNNEGGAHFEVPSTRSMLALRKLPGGEVNQSYIFFCQHFLKCVVGIQKFAKQWNKQYDITDIATPSDEAMTLLLLENSDMKWTREAEKGEKLPSKYTRTGYNKQLKGFTRRNQGWIKEGIVRFNALLAMVKQDRLENGAWFNLHVKDVMRQSHETTDEGTSLEATYPTAGHDLFDDDRGAVKNMDEDETTNIEKV